MHIDSSNLVGGKLTKIDAENGQKILVIEDTDNTTDIPYQNYRFIQSKALTEIAVAIHPYGAVIISTKTNEMVNDDGIDLSKYHVQVKFGGNIYWIDLESLLALDSGDDITFVPRPADAEDGENLDEELPPYSSDVANKYLRVSADGQSLEWSDVDGLPDTTGASTGDVLKLGEGGPEWGSAPSQLPDTTDKAGYTLRVNDSGTGYRLADVPDITYASDSSYNFSNAFRSCAFFNNVYKDGTVNRSKNGVSVRYFKSSVGNLSSFISAGTATYTSSDAFTGDYARDLIYGFFTGVGSYITVHFGSTDADRAGAIITIPISYANGPAGNLSLQQITEVSGCTLIYYNNNIYKVTAVQGLVGMSNYSLTLTISTLA